jgi:hypothetical protein
LKKLGNKSLEPGIVFAPYILQTTTSSVIIEVSINKSYSRKRKINKIFNIGIEIEGDKTFNPKKMLKSRYATKSINSNYFGKIIIS